MTSTVLAILTFAVVASAIVFAAGRLAELRETRTISRRLEILSRFGL